MARRFVAPLTIAFLGLLLAVLGAAPASGQVLETVLQQFYVPLPEYEMQIALDTIYRMYVDAFF